MSKSLGPPASAERLVRLLLPTADWRDSISGDLREEFTAVARRRGMAAARAWYWRQALRLSGRFAAGRVLRRRDLMRPWSPSTDFDEGGGWHRGWLREVRHATRAIGRRPALAAVVALTLGLSLAANATIYSVMDAIALRPYRFEGVDRLLLIASDSPDPIVDRETVAPRDFREWQETVNTVTDLAAIQWWNANLSEVDTPELVPAYKVTASFFKTLDVKPLLGRALTEEDDLAGNHRRIVLSHAIWTRKFASDRAIVGRTIRMDGEPYEVVGVLQAGFTVPFGSEVWAPIAYDAKKWSEPKDGGLMTIGRLVDGASLGNARAELTSIVEQQRARYPETHAKRELTVMSFNEGFSDPGGAVFLRLWQAAALLLLLIACANIANLLLARGTERAQEFSVRRALGASRSRLAAQLLLEGGMLAMLGVALSVPLAWIGLNLSRSSLPQGLLRFVPGWQFLAIDGRVLAVTAVLGATATIVFSMLPALHASRVGVAETIRESGRTQTTSRRKYWLRSTLATAQVALTLALLFGSGLMIAGADRAVNGALGFDKQNLLIAQLVLPEKPYAEAEARLQFVDRVLERMRGIPAVSDIAVSNAVPYTQSWETRRIWPEGQTLTEQETRSADYRMVSPALLDVLRVPIVAGRQLTDADREGSPPVAVVSRNFASRYWPDQDPIGRRFRIKADGELITVVGVSGDLLHNWFMQERRPTVYRPLAQDAPVRVGFVLRTVGDPLSLAGDLRRAIGAADPNQPISKLQSMDEVIDERTAGLTFLAKALAVVAFVALVLAIAGVYSLMAYTAGQRTKEIGVHVALGAGWWQVIRLTTGQALRITLVGSAIGAVMAAGVGQLMQTSLVGAVSNDYTTLAVLVIMLASVALLAAYLPARRAALLDPTTALRAD